MSDAAIPSYLESVDFMLPAPRRKPLPTTTRPPRPNSALPN
jgi:hypothetical protein